jgi:N-acylneuraminate cytidylyltransferase
VRADDVDGVVAALLSQGADSAFTATSTHAFLWRATDGGAHGVNHDERVRLRRQERDPEWIETGAVYAMRTAAFRSSGHRFSGRIALFEVPPLRALEIDEPADLEIARALAPLADRAARRDALPARVAAVVLDFDGVITDNRVLTAEDGTEAVMCDRGDGMGIERLQAAGVPVIVLSKERNPVVTARCTKLGVECVQGIEDKGAALTELMKDRGFDPADVVFVGNDVNDLECLAAVGAGVAVGDAYAAAREAADIVLSRPGGRGAVRELADMILEGQEEHR